MNGVLLSLKEQYDQLRLSSDAGARGAHKTDDPFIVKLMLLLFAYGAQVRASDIHIEPGQIGARVRFRIDGLLHELLNVPDDVRDPLIRAIKTKANLATDAVGRSKPQDGRIDFDVNGKNIDLRLSSFPTLFGDVLAIRILDRAAPLFKLEQLGFQSDTLQQFMQTIHRPNGLLLVTGPANSGKTTTLYGALEKLKSPHLKIVTLEDPVEYQMDGIDQAPINQQVGLTFASGLRAILRQDTNIILVGEIRDKETADIGIRAALTGHLVLSTLHTRHACGAVTRLIDMGVEPHLIVSCLNGVLAQRLLRVSCPSCQVPDSQGEQTAIRLIGEHGSSPEALPQPLAFKRGTGCADCNRTGYRGRSGVFEFLRLTDELKQSILQTRSSNQLHRLAIGAGMRTMVLDGLQRAAQGLTTVEEVLRVTGETEEL